MAFNPTDFPCPVAPAMRRWGIFAKSKTNVSLEMVLPMAIGSAALDLLNLSEAINVRMETMSGFELGTSMPMVPLPGMGAMMRMPKAARLRAMSSSRFFILEIRIPGAGTISYKVTVGPTCAVMLETSMLKFFRVRRMLFFLSSSSFSLTRTFPSPCSMSKSRLGNSNRLKSSLGSYSPNS